MCNEAVHVIGLYGPGDKISLLLQDWELAKVALSCHMALDMLCQEMHEAWLWEWCYREACCHGMSVVLSPCTGCDKKKERKTERKRRALF